MPLFGKKPEKPELAGITAINLYLAVRTQYPGFITAQLRFYGPMLERPDAFNIAVKGLEENLKQKGLELTGIRLMNDEHYKMLNSGQPPDEWFGIRDDQT